MFRDEKLELKVGLFIGAGLALMFLIVFSIKDVSMLGQTFRIKIIYDYVNGISESSPVRLAGVNIGQVEKVDLVYSENDQTTRVKLIAKVRGGTKIEEDSVVRINTLGLLGEQYVEIAPGKSKNYLKDGDVILGRNPLLVGQQMEKMHELIVSLSAIFQQVEKGQGSLGRLIMEDTLYKDLEVIFGRLRDGKGTIGKLLVEEEIYDNANAMVKDLKSNPWKLLQKPRESSASKTTTGRGSTVGTR